MKSIVVEHLTKTYKSTVKEKKEASFRELLLDQVTSFFKPALDITTFDALHDISFEVDQGEVLGIIGKNGSGKSTLLKILSKIMAPTSGKITIKGRVVSLLEVGTGFHGELSGRENIYLSGIILGMKRWEINQHFDEIVSFADIGNFLDTPVKHYSSGMRLRLAFSIAAHLRSDVLLMDEVLAVGDYEFEKKCLESVSNLSKSGRTILFVSHNLLSIKRLCSRVLVLQKGKQLFIGDPIRAIAVHLGVQKSFSTSLSWGEGGVNLHDLMTVYSLGVVNIHGTEQQEFYIEDPITLEFTYHQINFEKNFLVKFFLYDETQTLLFAPSHVISSSEVVAKSGICSLLCTIPGNILEEGQITVGISVLNIGQGDVCVDGESADLFSEKEAFCFIVKERTETMTILKNNEFWQIEKGKFRPAIQWQSSYSLLNREEV